MRPRFENVLQPQADGPAVPRPGGWRRLALTEEARDRDSASILACGLPVPATVDQARSRPWAAGTTEGGVRPPAQRTRARQSLFSRAGETHSGGRGGAGGARWGRGPEGGRRQKWVRSAPPPPRRALAPASLSSPLSPPPPRKFSLAHKHINKNKNRLSFPGDSLKTPLFQS